MKRLVVVSNRGPISYAQTADGSRETRRGVGGLVTALSGLVAGHEVTWVCAAMTDEDRAVAAEATCAHEEADRDGNRFRLRLVDVPAETYDAYYNVFANPYLWFLQHGLWNAPYAPIFDDATRDAWEAYRTVNALLADAVAEEAREADAAAVLVHDYQLYLVPELLGSRGVEAPVTHFTHIPWPGPDAWHFLPPDIRRAIVVGILGGAVAGFHTRGFARSFLRTVIDVLPDAEVSIPFSTVAREGRLTLVRSYPISIDVAGLEAIAASDEVTGRLAEVDDLGAERLVLRVDRTDPSKNVVRGFQAFGRFLADHPEWHGRVRMLALMQPSRQHVPEYVAYVEAMKAAASDVNAAYGQLAWEPVVLSFGDDFPSSVAAYRRYDVLLVNTLADGMNLVAKEGPVVNQRDGVVILSEAAGAHEELREHVISVNPYDVSEQARAIATALELDPAERARRARALVEAVRAADVGRWIADQLSDIDRLPRSSPRPANPEVTP